MIHYNGGQLKYLPIAGPLLIKEIPNGFPCLDFGYSDQNTRDVARLRKTKKKHEPLG